MNNPLRYTDPTGLLTQDEWAALAAAGERLRKAGVPESEWASTLRAIAKFQEDRCFVPTDALTPAPGPTPQPGMDIYGGVEFALLGGLGGGGEVKVSFVMRDGHLHMLITVAAGGFAPGGIIGGVGPVVGSVPENQSLAGPYADASLCGAFKVGGCGSFSAAPDSMAGSVIAGPGISAGASGMAGRTYDIDLGSPIGGLAWLKDQFWPF